LAALGAILAAAHFNAAVTDRAFALAQASDDQDLPFEIIQQIAQRLRYRVDLDLPGGLPQGIVVRRRYTATKDADHEALVHWRSDYLDLDAAFLDLIHDVFHDVVIQMDADVAAHGHHHGLTGLRLRK
jgi:hypothetical protein